MDFINRVELQGIVGKVRESMITDVKVYTFSMLIEHVYQSKDGFSTIESTWVSIHAYGDIVDGTLEQGKFAKVTGRLRNQSLIDASNRERTIDFILADSVQVFNQ